MRRCLWSFLLVVAPICFTHSQGVRAYEALINNGNRALDLGHYQEAVEEFSKAVAMMGNRPEGYLSRAMAYHSLNKNQKAIIDYTSVIEIQPEIRESYYGRAIIYHEEGNFEAAYRDLLRLRDLGPSETNSIYFKSRAGESGVSELSTLSHMEGEVYTYLGDICNELGKYDSSNYYFQQAIALDPFNADIRINMAKSYEKRGLQDLAIEEYGSALKIEPDNAIAMYNLALISMESGSQKTREIFTSVIEANPNITEAYEHRALAAFEEGDYTEAYEDYKIAITLDENDAGKWYNLGLILDKLNRYKSAYESFTKALELGGDKGSLYRNRANVLFKLRDYETAEADYTLALSYDSSNPSSYYNRAISRRNLGKDKEACADIKQAVRLGMNAAKQIESKICK